MAPENVDEAVAFIGKARQEMFPMLDKQLYGDVVRFIESGYFFMAKNLAGEIIATIGFVPYNYRFPHLDFRDMKVVEVVRLYVLPEWRRAGMGAELVDVLKRKALDEGIDCFYLHTHPFLPGAVSFWENRGFSILDVEEDPVWRTTHMQMMLGS